MRSIRMAHRGRLAGASAFVMAMVGSSAARADVAWVGDFETHDLSQWQPLNGEHIDVVETPITQGLYSGHITLTNDAVWPNGLKRVELHHGPADGRTGEGKSLCVAWSFYLPVTLPEDPQAQIGYWESGTSYKQMIGLNLVGDSLTMITHQPSYQEAWTGEHVVTPAQWHRLAWCVLWSKDAAKGTVDMWFDGDQVVTGFKARTLNDDNPHFTQVGLLRGQVEFADAPEMFIDDAVEGDTIDDVRPADLPSEGTGGGDVGGGGAGSGGGASTTAVTTSGGDGGGSGTTSGAGGSSGAGSSDSGSEAGCGCSADGSTRGEGGGWLLGLVVANALVLRSRRARSKR